MADDAEQTIVLDTAGFWRMHHTLKPPVIRFDEGLKPEMLRQDWLNWATPEPPADWADLEFDDGTWLRGPGLMACETAYLSRICFRGRFQVADPARVGDLRLSLVYHGGVRICVNGRELARAHLPAGPIGPETLAEDYPAEAFVTERGELLVEAGQFRNDARAPRPSEESIRRIGLRTRRLEGVHVPASLLRKGVNVLALEVVRSPYHKVLQTIAQPRRPDSVDFRSTYDFSWDTCRLLKVRLTAAGDDTVTSNAARPQGLQVWNGSLLVNDFDTDYGDPCEPLRPVELTGVRGGAFTGKLLVGSARALENLRVVAGELTCGQATIPATSVQVRYGISWGEQRGAAERYVVRTPALLGALADSCPAVVPVAEKSFAQRPGEPKLLMGAVVPLWITASVPRDAKAGTYEGRLRITVDGEAPRSTTLRLKVLDWTLPEKKDWGTWVDMIQSPETLALEYGVELWSDRHFELIARTFDLLSEVGNRTLYLPLIAPTNLGNAESMVRWIPKEGGRYEHDFSVMDRYLDVALKHMGKPRVVVCNAWDIYMIPKEDNSTTGQHGRLVRTLNQRKTVRGLGPRVTALDPATGKTSNLALPPYMEEGSRELWQPLLKEVQRRLAERGLAEAMMIGMITDGHPTREEVEFLADILPGVPWVSQAHYGFDPGKLLQGVARIGYQARVWSVCFADSVPHRHAVVTERLYGWKVPYLRAVFERFTGTDTYPLTRWYHVAEYTVTSDHRGIGRWGADFWDVIRDGRGRRKGTVADRFPESSWMYLGIATSLLAPGPDGAVATTRFEAFRSGLQVCEARIFIERALTDDALRACLGDDLARRCQEALDERMLFMWKGLSNLQLTGTSFAYATGWRWLPGINGHAFFAGSGWQQRAEGIFRLAAEVAAKLNAK